MKFNDSFYPTPEDLICKMVSKIHWGEANYILEPSAGAGHIIKQMRDSGSRHRRLDIHSIEIDDDLRNMLIGSGEKVVGKDFLNYAGLIQFDTIIMNPPFSNGEAHLLKAIDILYSGQIVCLLNAETIRNPHTNQKLDLVSRLEDLGAEIEYIQNAFLDAERKTAVEVALITIKIEREVENDLFAGAEDRVREHQTEEIDGQIKDVAKPDTIEAVVDDYNFRVKMGIKTIQDFYRNSKYIGGHMQIVIEQKDLYDRGTLTQELKKKTNEFLESIRHSFWNKTLTLPQFEKRLTEAKSKEFRESLKRHSDIEFTVANVRAFFENLMGSYQKTLTDAIEDLFDTMTIKYAWDEALHNKNVHYYNGWKTNDAFKVNKRVIMPYIGLEHVWDNKYKLRWESTAKLNDIDKVMNYFEGKNHYLKISDSAAQFEEGRGDIFQLLESEFFMIRFYKKGTTHLTFKSEDIRRRFNIEVGKRKGWLPQDYGHVPFEQLTHETQEIVKSFEENVKEYDNNLNQIGLAKQDLLMIEEAA